MNRYRGERFKDFDAPEGLKGNNDLLSLTQPHIIQGIHEAYLKSGSDIIETNTFSGTTIAMADYKMEHLVKELNIASAQLARAACDKYEALDGRPRFVAGAMGPTNRTGSISPSVEDASVRNVTFEELRLAYYEQAEALLEGGVDILFVETIFDTLNAKAALFAIDELFEKLGRKVPVVVSGTIVDLSGRTLSGQTTEAFYTSIRHAKPFAVGLNCALGADQMRPFLERLAKVAECYVSVYPNAGLPNAMGGYDDTPEQVASAVSVFADLGLINFAGGCCGCRPGHVAAIAETFANTAKYKPRPRYVRTGPPVMMLSGLEQLIVDKSRFAFMNIGERCNIAGSLVC